MHEEMFNHHLQKCCVPLICNCFKCGCSVVGFLPYFWLHNNKINTSYVAVTKGKILDDKKDGHY